MSDRQYSIISFRKSKTYFSITSASYHFKNFGSFIWLPLVVSVMLLTGHGANVVFVALLIKVMWKVPFL